MQSQKSNNTKATALHHCIDKLVFKMKEYIISKDLNDKLKGSGTSLESFKHKAEQLAIAHILEDFPDSRVCTQELGILNESLADCRYTFVVKCLSESMNIQHHIPFYSLAVAVLEGKSLGCASVVYSLLADLATDIQLSAVRGSGVTSNGHPFQPLLNAKASLVGCNMDSIRPEALALVNKVILSHRRIRWFGSSTMSLVYLIQGRCSAYYDVRGLAKADNFLAASLLLEETGGILTDTKGQPLNNIPDLNHSYNFVASLNKEDHKSFLEVLQ